ncbi:hypothetical protein COO60DRAFT_510071 [Scenedesmus sp. NREL 46B-D3]|nr:hypothetical protein COO60DRAFT_510071 [Scenedesmus sp. NREL 46B-D3]
MCLETPCKPTYTHTMHLAALRRLQLLFIWPWCFFVAGHIYCLSLFCSCHYLTVCIPLVVGTTRRRSIYGCGLVAATATRALVYAPHWYPCCSKSVW